MLNLPLQMRGSFDRIAGAPHELLVQRFKLVDLGLSRRGRRLF